MCVCVCVCVYNYAQFSFGNDLSEHIGSPLSFNQLYLLCVLICTYISQIDLLTVVLDFPEELQFLKLYLSIRSYALTFYLNDIVSLYLGNLWILEHRETLKKKRNLQSTKSQNKNVTQNDVFEVSWIYNWLVNLYKILLPLLSILFHIVIEKILLETNALMYLIKIFLCL